MEEWRSGGALPCHKFSIKWKKDHAWAGLINVICAGHLNDENHLVGCRLPWPLRIILPIFAATIPKE